MSAKKVLITAGGTGGHVFPALAVAKHLQAQGCDVAWLGTQKGLEAKVIPKENIPLFTISSTQLRGQRLVKLIKAPLLLAKAFFQTLKIFRTFKPDVVLGMGGYVSGPGGVVARLLRIPLVIHEQNAVAGLTNKILAKIATRACESFAGSLPAHANVILTGNPVRDNLIHFPSPEQRLANRNGQFNILILGGSLGAQYLNQNIPQALFGLPASVNVNIWHQCGERHLESTKANYQQLQLTAKVEPFIDNMQHAYDWAHLVICRAGALTVSELANVGVASILIPYPHAADDHQRKNANVLAALGAAICIPEKELQPSALTGMLISLVEQPEQLVAMAVASKQFAAPDATAKVAQACLEACGDF